MASKVLIMAGGTGGHVFPALACARLLQEQGYEVHWLGTRRGIEAELIPQTDIALHYIDIQGLRGKGKLDLLMAPVRLIRALWQSFKVLRELQPVCVLGAGGYVSGPGGVAASHSVGHSRTDRRGRYHQPPAGAHCRSPL